MTGGVRGLGMALGSLMACLFASAQVPLTLLFEGFPEGEAPTTVHLARESNPLTNTRTWVGTELVDGSGTCVVPAERLGSGEFAVWQVAAPPWVWRVWTWEGAEEADLVYVLEPRKKIPMRLMDVPGRVRPMENAHPMALQDSLLQMMDSLWQGISYDVMLRAGTVAGGAVLVDSVVIASAEAQFEKRRSDLLASAGIAPVVQPMFKAIDVDWDLRLGRQPEQLIWNPMSFGEMSSWVAAHLFWWERPAVDIRGMQVAIRGGDLDGLRVGMGPDWGGASEEELAAAWLLWETVEHGKWGRVEGLFGTQSVIETWLEELRAMRQEGHPGSTIADLRWTTPSGDLEMKSEFTGEAAWCVALVIRGASSAAEAERELFNRLAEQFADRRRDVKFVVLSVDGRTEDWESTLNGRTSRKEQTRWLGAVPEVWESLGVVTVPMVVAIDPEGRLSGEVRALPSRGLARELERILR